MSFAPRVSLIIVSRHRPEALKRVVSSLRFQSYTNFEVILVSDAPDRSFLADIPASENMLHIPFDQANISAARNAGLAHAQGEIVAFCDDDAVPDPNWLKALVQPFRNTEIASAGGFVRGRNGFSYQWKGLTGDRLGEDQPLAIDPSASFVEVRFDGGRFAKLQGTNCAFRLDALLGIGGFDEGFRFYLDETDVCLRLAQAGYSAAFVNAAEVHHGFEQSAHRSANRVPLSLYEIGASKRRFLDKHCIKDAVLPAKQRFFADQKQRLLRLMVEGRLEPRDVPVLMDTLQNGLNETRQGTDSPPVRADRVFKPLKSRENPPGVALAGGLFATSALFARAQDLAKSDAPVIVFRLARNSLFHRRYFDVRGFWVQTGGIFGKSSREDSVFRWWTLSKRTRRELIKFYAEFGVTETQIL
ncbi:glycosyltransferase family 2 protein [Neptunicoccus cionae]|uniref:glycosyltransferase family 2 protein n=1 Tax=Neptunicoccus cionae TaxID=2035344 RepID=UPI000C75CC7F|nr:glycosyltransferase [Amylibacter cionae]PLS22756.1 glycosyl transferase [Amylibacter cionae]